jgi:hypothetical protein
MAAYRPVMPQVVRVLPLARWHPCRVEEPDWPTLVALDDGVKPQPAASEAAISDCESALGATMPSDLRALFRYSDGLWDDPGQWFVVWPLVDVLARNQAAYESEVPGRRGWIGFGDDGTGNPFCFNRLGGDDVHYWSGTEGWATPLADRASSFWTRWVADTLPHH